MADIYITINEDGSISIKDECAPGQEQQSMEDRDLLKDLADVVTLSTFPTRENRGRGRPLQKKQDERVRVRGTVDERAMGRTTNTFTSLRIFAKRLKRWAPIVGPLISSMI